MRSVFDDLDDIEQEDEGKTVFLFQGEFPGYEREPVRGTILRKEERYYTLNLIGADLSPIVAKKRGKRIAIAMEVFFETRVPGKFNEPVILGKGEAFYFPSDNALYIQDLYIRQAPGKIGTIIPVHKHTNTIRLWKSFEKYGLDHGVGHPLLLLDDVKAPHGQNGNEFKALCHYPSASL